ncbi:MAG: threonine/serine exporter family protein [Nocardioides sp.]|nr:threonine/serine exporter family protein [Nocardioides sp.]
MFVRVGTGESSRVDVAPGGNVPLRLDQVDELNRLIDDIRHATSTVSDASDRLQTLLVASPGNPSWVRVVGSGVLTVGQGLLLNRGSATS